MSTDDTGISVAGVGQSTTTPDVARVAFGVSVRGATVAEASELARERVKAMLESLSSSGVAKADIQTTNYSVFADYDHPNGKERLLGYRVDNDVQVTLRDLETIGSLIDAAARAGGDAVTVNRLNFDVDDDTEARNAAREVAWRDAKAGAEHLARLAGRELGPVVRISESPGSGPMPRRVAAPMAAESTPIEAGTSTITVTLDVRFELS